MADSPSHSAPAAGTSEVRPHRRRLLLGAVSVALGASGAGGPSLLPVSASPGPGPGEGLKRGAAERGRTLTGWLDSRHSFAFGNYTDPRHVRFGPLRVLNEDIVAPGAGFPTHGHRDREILTYVLSGGLEHRDSLGHHSVVTPGRIQLLSAGSGIEHSECNASAREPVHFLQIWLLPRANALPPRYSEHEFPPTELRGRLHPIASGRASVAPLVLAQDATVFAGRLHGTDRVLQPLAPERRAYVHVARGTLDVGGLRLAAGDAVLFGARTEIAFESAREAEVLLFDLPA